MPLLRQIIGERHGHPSRSQINTYRPYQTTVPEAVRRVLKLGKRDKSRYTIRPNGEVVLTRAVPSGEEDPVLGQFLGFLAREIVNHPERLQPVDSRLAARIQSLVGDIEVDFNAPLSTDDE